MYLVMALDRILHRFVNGEKEREVMVFFTLKYEQYEVPSW